MNVPCLQQVLYVVLPRQAPSALYRLGALPEDCRTFRQAFRCLHTITRRYYSCALTSHQSTKRDIPPLFAAYCTATLCNTNNRSIAVGRGVRSLPLPPSRRGLPPDVLRTLRQARLPRPAVGGALGLDGGAGHGWLRTRRAAGAKRGRRRSVHHGRQQRFREGGGWSDAKHLRGRRDCCCGRGECARGGQPSATIVLRR